ncbi:MULTISPECIES: DUF6182 family protein [unclassified Streptomyces]|jgi:hypothetical protein|uniref:DUF6182 family protein n=1 Tax=unclassified Streptomyces TaxID=2593676 RepID=UPI00081B40F1|nr:MULTISPECIES: DUF6182 family protein [unclassified Streptomyces]MYQ82934.1 hypothetical protein [Streptomyces sp. SID4936]SCD55693.1 hypothetical protein GA0115234_102945 [Streptomyces sp. DvalAA-43]
MSEAPHEVRSEAWSEALPEAQSDVELLTAAARTRLRAAHDGLGDGPVPWGVGVAVVVADLDVATFIAGVADFALTLPDDLCEGWYRAFTRTVFLAGRPASVAARHPGCRTTAGAPYAWYGPARRGELRPLSRLLRAFDGPAPIDVPTGPLTVTVPGGEPSGHVVDAAVAIGGVSTGDYLVHVHHLIAEAALRGLIGPGDTLRVDHRKALDTAEFRDLLAPARADRVQTRITRSRTEPHHPRLYGVLESNRLQGGH